MHYVKKYFKFLRDRPMAFLVTGLNRNQIVQIKSILFIAG